MPFDSEGKFTRNYNWEEDRLNDISIDANRMDDEFDNYADGLSETMLRDGRVPMSGVLNAGGFNVRNVADGRLEKDAVNLSQLVTSSDEMKDLLKAAVNKLVAVGDIKTSVRAENHENWILCNGQAISRAKYSELFDIIGVSFGSGDGSSTFNVPDYRGKFIRGLGGDSASNIQTTQAESLPKLTGGPLHVGSPWQGTATSGVLKAVANGAAHNDSGSTGWDLYFDSSSNSIYNGSHVTPINQALNFFIKAKSED